MSGTDAREQPAHPAGPAKEAGGSAEPTVPAQAAGERAVPARDGGKDAGQARPARPREHVGCAARAVGPEATGGYQPQRGRGWLVALVVAVVVAAGVAGADAAGLFRQAKPAAASSSGYQTGTQTVTRGSLTSQIQQNGTLGNAGSYTVVVPSSSPGSGLGSGTYTWLPAAGRTIRQGQVAYRVSGVPVVLLYGRVPAYRDLSEGITGADVTELNADLVRLGHASAAALGPRSGWDYFSSETAYALEQLQTKLGLTVTGTLPLGQAMFLPGPAQVSGLGTGVVPGAPATAGSVVLTATSVTPVVTIDLDASLQGEVKTGDKVLVTLPDGATTPGVISQVSNVASSSSSSSPSSSSNSGNGNGNSSGATITVTVTLTHPKAAGHLNQAPVTVTITTGSAHNVLIVPVNALLAQPGGKYAVEVTGPGGHHLVTVTPGMFDDATGTVQVTGKLTPGQHVVVPGI